MSQYTSRRLPLWSLLDATEAPANDAPKLLYLLWNAKRESPTDGAGVGARGFRHSAYCIIPFQHRLEQVHQPKVLVDNDVPTATNILWIEWLDECSKN